MKPLLTIAIPTFNRAEKLRAQLTNLSHQLTTEVTCCIFDNASPDKTHEVATSFKASGVNYFRIPFNSGGNRNILRCFEECQSEWLWILSDDDPITSTAVEDLLSIIKTCSADFIHTSSHLCRHTSNNIATDIPQLLKTATISSLLWISTGIYRISKFQPLLGTCAESISTWGAQLVIVLNMLERASGSAFTTSTNLTISPLIEAPRWRTLDFIVRFCHVPEYLKDPNNQKLVAQSICNEQYYWALLTGLRELNHPIDINRWQRIRRLSKQTFKSFGATSPLSQIIQNGAWWKTGRRKASLLILHHAILLQVLALCPSFCFPNMVVLLPKPTWLDTLLKVSHGKKLETH